MEGDVLWDVVEGAAAVHSVEGVVLVVVEGAVLAGVQADWEAPGAAGADPAVGLAADLAARAHHAPRDRYPARL